MLSNISADVPAANAYEIGYQAAHTALAPFAWSKAVGARLDTTAAANLLDISRQALAKRVANGSLLGLPGKNTTHYPAWQFDQFKHIVRPEVRQILQAFDDHDQNDSYMIAAWMMASNRELDGITPASWLENGKEVERLLSAARNVAKRWDT